MKKHFLIFLLIATVACQNESKTNEVTVANKYSLQVPDYLSKTNDLNEDASLQYQNLFKEFYVIVIDEDKDEINSFIDAGMFENNPEKSVDGYATIIMNNTKKNTEVKNEAIQNNLKINNLQSKTICFDAKVDKIDIFFQFGFIEGKDRYYQVMVWTLLKHKQKYLEDMDKIILSFKEEKSRKKKI